MARREATIEDLYRVPDKAEIVNGELVIITPAGGLHGYAVGRIYASLPNRRSFSPDVEVLEDNVVRVYHAADPENATCYRRGEDAEAAPALPGWSMPVDDLFPSAPSGS